MGYVLWLGYGHVFVTKTVLWLYVRFVYGLRFLWLQLGCSDNLVMATVFNL